MRGSDYVSFILDKNNDIENFIAGISGNMYEYVRKRNSSRFVLFYKYLTHSDLATFGKATKPDSHDKNLLYYIDTTEMANIEKKTEKPFQTAHQSCIGLKQELYTKVGLPQPRKVDPYLINDYMQVCYADNFEFPKPIELKFTMQDFLLDNCAEGNFIVDENGNIVLKKGGQLVTKFLSDKLIAYVMSPGTKNFYHEDAQIDLPIARAILSTQGNSHRASVNNYVTTNGHIRALEPRESLRLMGFPDSFKITVSRSQSYKQSGNSIVVDVLMAIVKQIKIASEGDLWKE